MQKTFYFHSQYRRILQILQPINIRTPGVAQRGRWNHRCVYTRSFAAQLDICQVSKIYPHILSCDGDDVAITCWCLEVGHGLATASKLLHLNLSIFEAHQKNML